MRYSFTKVSANVKTGPIPVTMTEKTSCPNSCALKSNGCYAESGNVNIHWQRLGKTKPDGKMYGKGFEEFIHSIVGLPRGQLWRHNVAGDLTSDGVNIDNYALESITRANKGGRGFTYTHAHDKDENIEAIRKANDNGFTVNLSANSADDADRLSVHNLPLVCLVDIETPVHSLTPGGLPIITCPATRSDSIACATCGLCQISYRKSIVGFPVHGTSKKKARTIMLKKV